MKNELLHIKGLSVAYQSNSPILDEVNLTVKSEELILVIGENGAGKSTLLKTISGLIKPETGSIKLFTKELKEWDRRELAKKMAYVSSSNSINHLMTVKDFISFGRYPYSNWFAKQNQDDLTIINEVVEQCNILHLLDKQISEISDGEKQKVFIARALAQKAELFILDEPTTHLDIKNTQSIFYLLKMQKEQFQKTIIFSSHQVEKALKIADKIWIVDQNRVIESSVEKFNATAELREIVFGKEEY